jgi:hypothetical protein
VAKGLLRTASFLSGGQLDGSPIQVHWTGDDSKVEAGADAHDHHDGEIRQVRPSPGGRA